MKSSKQKKDLASRSMKNRAAENNNVFLDVKFDTDTLQSIKDAFTRMTYIRSDDDEMVGTASAKLPLYCANDDSYISQAVPQYDVMPSTTKNTLLLIRIQFAT